MGLSSFFSLINKSSLKISELELFVALPGQLSNRLLQDLLDFVRRPGSVKKVSDTILPFFISMTAISSELIRSLPL
jgi:hypothetical protein